MSKHQEENPRNHPRRVPLNVIIKVNVEESPSRFTLEGLHDRVVSEVVKEEITLDDHDRIATLQNYHQECVMRDHPRHSIVALQSRATKGA